MSGDSGARARVGVVQALQRFALRRPRTVIAAALMQTLGIAFGLPRLELGTDGRALVPSDAPEVLADAAVRERFGLRDTMAVVVESRGAGGIYEPLVLERIQDLSRAMTTLDGVREADVESLATERSDRTWSGTLQPRPWLDPFPRSVEELDGLRRDLEEVEIYSGTLIASDRPASAAAVLVGIPPDADRASFAREVRATVRATLRPGDEERLELHVVGAPLAEAELGMHLLSDLSVLVPLAVLAMAAIFLLAFRSPFAVLLPLAEVGATLITVFALMGWSGTPVYLTVAVLPVILTAVGVADELHVLTAFLRRCAAESAAPARSVVEATMREMTRPVAATSLTTSLGFLAFAASPLVPVRAFGIFMAVGVLHCMVWSLFVTPAFLVLIPRERWHGALARPGGGWIGGARVRLAALHRWVRARRKLTLAISAAVLALCPLGIARVEVRDSWVGGFSEASELRRATERVDELFAGTHLLRIAVGVRETRASGRVARAAFGESEVLLPAEIAGDPARLRGHRLHVRGLDERGAQVPSGVALTARILSAERAPEGTRLHFRQEGAFAGRGSLARWLPPSVRECAFEIDAEDYLLERAVLERIGAFEAHLGALEEARVGRASGPFEHLSTMRFLQRGRRPEARAIPESLHETEGLLTRYALARGEERLRRLFDPGHRSGLVTVFLKRADSVATERVIEAARAYAREHLEPELLSIEIGGDAAVSQALVGGIVRTQLLSLLLALPAVALAASLVFRSLLLGLLCALPASVAVLVDFALLGFAGIPLGVATSMFAGMTIGIGVDHSIHLLSRRRRALRSGATPDAASLAAFSDVGPAITLDALALGAAFGLFLFSAVPTNARLGALMVASLATCLAASLLLTALLPTVASRNAMYN